MSTAPEGPTPEIAQGMVPRALLHELQTNVNPDPEAALRWAPYALAAATDQEVQASDPTIYPELAALIAFRNEQALDRPVQADYWLGEALRSVPTGSRAEADVYLLRGRTIALRTLVLEEVSLDADQVAAYTEQATAAFRTAEEVLQELRQAEQPDAHALTPHDRYGTMLDRHYATFEAIKGDAGHASRIALRGIGRALFAEREQNNLSNHARFVAKHALGNLGALMLAATRPLDRLPNVRQRRHDRAVRVVGSLTPGLLQRLAR
ncbi:MAG TPA: hypothetical protein VHC98_00350 [Candidatus Saccharimonadales bacterium]|nr:hypothetical protein [Candidatus Saccharimonadales bacterium]